MNTNVIPSAHNSKQTIQLFPDNRFEQPIIHVLIVNGDGKVVAQHDAPRDILASGLADLVEGDQAGETPPESTLDALKAVGAAGRTLPTAPLTVADLSAKHIGKRARITYRDNVHTGTITGFNVETESNLLVDHSPVMVHVVFDETSSLAYPLTATVEVL